MPHTRPSWDEYFMDITKRVATRSTCLRRAVGAIIVHDKRIIATGYNGGPTGLSHCLDIGCLREQLGIIQDELGEGANSEIGEYTRSVLEAKLPQEAEEKLLKEIDRMAKTPFGSSEATVMRAHLDACLELPWNKLSKERTSWVPSR